VSYEVDFEIWRGDRLGNKIEDVTDRFMGGNISYDRTRRVRLNARFTFHRADMFDPYVDTIIPYIYWRKVGDGDDYQVQQLSMFLFDEPQGDVIDDGMIASLNCRDQTWLLDLAATRTSFTAKKNTGYVADLIDLWESVGIFYHEEPASGPKVAATVTWPSSTNRLDIANELTDAMAYTPTYQLLEGSITTEPALTVSSREPVAIWLPEDFLRDPNIVQPDSSVPNIIIVKQDNPKGVPITVTKYNQDRKSPTSIPSRGGVEISQEYETNFFSITEAKIFADIMLEQTKAAGAITEVLVAPVYFFNGPSTVRVDFQSGEVDLTGLHDVLAWTLPLDGTAMQVRLGQVVWDEDDDS
jgi:hypothetical protein